MKRKILTLLIILTFSSFLTAQEIRINSKIYSVKVYRTDQKKTEKLILYSVTDTSIIVIAENELNLLLNNELYNKTEYTYSEIRRISVKRKNNLLQSTGKGAAIGFLSGAAFSTAIILTEDTKWISDKTAFLLFSVTGTIVGALNGVIAGLLRENYQIDFDKSKFEKFEKRFSDRSLIK
jgi:hypothetical protein